jgi:adenosine kinase
MAQIAIIGRAAIPLVGVSHQRVTPPTDETDDPPNMRIAVTGSIATDHLMMFSGKFADTLIADKLDKISVSYLVGDLQVRRGGVAGNISYGLGSLGLRPLLVGSAGRDFAEYRTWLEEHGVDTSGVRISETRHTARFTATNDTEGNQIASFYPGAMSEDGEIDIVALAKANDIDLVVIGAGDPGAMQRFTTDCRGAGIPFAADFSQQVAFLDGESMRPLIDGAAYLFSNEYEEAAIEQKTGWSSADILDRVQTRVVTLGSAGAKIERKGKEPVLVGAVKDATFVEPTGAGDAFRSGFLAAVAWDLPLERAIELGNLLAVHALETVGPQEYELKPANLGERASAAYGDASATAITAKLTA